MNIELTELEKEFIAHWVGGRKRSNSETRETYFQRSYWAFGGVRHRSAETIVDSETAFVKAVKILRANGIEIIFNKSHRDENLEQVQLMRLPSSGQTGVEGIREDGESVEYALYRAIIAYEKLKTKKELKNHGKIQQTNRSGIGKAGVTE